MDLHPVMGSFSLLLRAPLVAPRLARRQPSARLPARRACLLHPCGDRRHLAGRRDRGSGPGPTRSGGVRRADVVNPITVHAVRSGHPEEVLGGALAVLAVVCAARGRSMQAAVALGLAIGTKQWTLLAVLPALFAASASARRSIALIAASVGIVLAVSAPLADWRDYREKAHALGVTTTASPYSAWSAARGGSTSSFPASTSPRRSGISLGLSREDISLVVPIVCTVIVLAFARRRRWRLSEQEAMALLAISFLCASCSTAPCSSITSLRWCLRSRGRRGAGAVSHSGLPGRGVRRAPRPCVRDPERRALLQRLRNDLWLRCAAVVRTPIRARPGGEVVGSPGSSAELVRVRRARPQRRRLARRRHLAPRGDRRTDPRGGQRVESGVESNATDREPDHPRRPHPSAARVRASGTGRRRRSPSGRRWPTVC